MSSSNCDLIVLVIHKKGFLIEMFHIFTNGLSLDQLDTHDHCRKFHDHFAHVVECVDIGLLEFSESGHPQAPQNGRKLYMLYVVKAVVNKHERKTYLNVINQVL